MNRITAIMSGKGGVGKTVTTINLALALQELGEPVVIVDGDMTVSNLSVQLNAFDFNKTLHDVLNSRESILNAIHTHPSGVCFVPSSLSADNIYINAQTNSKKLKRELKKINGWVILDCPPGLNDEVLSILEIVDDAIVVTNPEPPAVTDAMKLVKIAEQFETKINGIIVNRVTGKDYELNENEIESACEAEILGKVPEDERIKQNLTEEEPLLKKHPYSTSGLQFRKIAHNIKGLEYRPPRFSFIKRIFNFG